MFIQQKSIRSLRGRFRHIRKGSQIVIGARLIRDLLPKLERIGFPPDAEIGDSVLPAAIGPKTNFNANGAVIIHKDQPKETAIRWVEWTWEQWNGRYDTETMSDFVNVPYKRYPRTPVPPPAVELKIAVGTDGQRMLVSPPITFNGEDDKHLLHVVNMFLEILGFCQIFTNNLDEIIKAPLRRLNWKILPNGHRTWGALRPNIIKVIRRAPDGNQSVIEHRLETINRYEPDFVAIGQAGFAGYVVFGFTSRKLFFFESIYIGNATYVFGDDWEHLSKLTKSQVMENGLHKARVIHRVGWESGIRALLRPSTKPK